MLPRLFVVCLLATVLGVISPSRAKADDIFIYQLGGGPTYTWELPASPTIPANDAGQFSFVIPDLPYWVNGVQSSFPDQFDFMTASDGGGFAILESFPPFSFHVVLDEFGPQLFVGSTGAPTFVPGTYTLTDPKSGLTGTLEITTPEPGSLFLIGSGALALLGAGRKRASRADLCLFRKTS